MASEKAFEKKIKDYLTEKGAWGVKFFANRNTKSGIPDLLYCVNGRFLAIEVKGDAGSPTELQIRNIRKINAADGIAFVAWPQAEEVMKNIIDTLVKQPHYELQDFYNEYCYAPGIRFYF